MQKAFSRYRGAWRLALICLAVWLQPALTGELAVSADIELSPDQKAWLAQHPVIRVALDPEFAPIEFMDETGQYRGIAADYLALVERKLGIRFSLVRPESWEQVINKAKAKEIDMFSALARSADREKYLSFTNRYLKLPGVFIVKKTVAGPLQPADLKGKNLAVVSGYVWQELIARDHPDITLVTVPNLATGLDHVSKGTVTALLANRLSAMYYIRQNALTGLRIAGESGYHTRLSLAVRKDWVQLKEILEEVQDQISIYERRAIIDKWVEPQSTGTVVLGITLSTEEALTLDGILRRVAALEKEGGLDEASRNKALEHYRTASSALENARSAKAQATLYRKAIESGPAEAKRIRDKLEQPASLTGMASLGLGLSKDTPTEQLEKSVARVDAEMAAVKRQLSNLTERITSAQPRPDVIRKELAKENRNLSALNKQLESTALEIEMGIVGNAERAATQAKKRAHMATTLQLEQELLSHDARLDLLRVQREQLSNRLTRLQTLFKQARELMNQRRASEAAEVQAAAEQARQQAEDKHPVIRQAAEENAELSRQLSKLVERIKRRTREQERVGNDLKEIDQIYQTVREHLEVGGFSEALGEVLRAQRRRLPNVERYRSSAADRDRQIGEARLSQLRIDDQRRRLRDVETQVEKLITDADLQISAKQQETSASELTDLLVARRDLLDRLWQTHQRYVKQLRDLDLSQKRLLDKAQQYVALLDKDLLWIASNVPVGWTWLDHLVQSSGWLVSPANWSEVGHQLARESRDRLILTTLVLLAFTGLLVLRKRTRRYLDSDNQGVGDPMRDNFLLTAKSLVMLILYIAPWPLAIGYAAWLLGGVDQSSSFSEAVAVGGYEVSKYLFILAGFRVLCWDGGLAEVHFQWSRRSCTVFRDNLPWLMAVALPLAFVIGLTDSQPDELHRDSLGRLAFVVGSIALSVFGWRVLHPKLGILVSYSSGWQRYLKYTVFLLAFTLPGLFSVLALVGYYFTGLNLERQVVETVLVVAGAVLLHSILERWLVLAQRGLTRARVRAARKAVQTSSQTGDTTQNISQDLPDILEVDLMSINDQTRKLFQLVVVLAAAAAIWVTWSDVLAAFAILGEVTLWQHRVITEGAEGLAPVTLQDLALALFVAVLTITAGTNLPGLLEIGVLQRFKVKPGTLYTISTLTRYAIITGGVIIAFNLIGIGWTQVQWLAAAIGVGLGFGLREIFASFIAGLIILFERPIRVGDIVTLGEFSGTVTKIRIRATTITDWDNKETVIPNNLLVTQQLTNWTLSDEITRVVIKVGLAYGSDTKLAEKVMMEIAKANSMVLEDPPPSVLFLGFGEHSLGFEVRVFTKDQLQRLTLTHQLHMALERGLHERGIEIALPQLDLRLRSDLTRLESGQPLQEAADSEKSRTLWNIKSAPDPGTQG